MLFINSIRIYLYLEHSQIEILYLIIKLLMKSFLFNFNVSLQLFYGTKVLRNRKSSLRDYCKDGRILIKIILGQGNNNMNNEFMYPLQYNLMIIVTWYNKYLCYIIQCINYIVYVTCLYVKCIFYIYFTYIFKTSL